MIVSLLGWLRCATKVRRPAWLPAALFTSAVAMSLALVACTSPPLEVRLGIVGASQPLWRYVAQEKDQFLPPYKYEVSFLSYPTEAALKGAFLAKEVDVIATLPPQLPALAQAGVDVQYFSPIAWIKEGYPIVVPNESAIRSPADLAGAKLSTFPSDHPGLGYWQAFIQENYGFRLAEQTSLVVSQNPEGALLNGQADAATVDSVAWSQLKGQGKYRAISDLATEWTRLSGSIRPLLYGGYVARKEWITKNRGFVEDFIQANYRALQAYKKDPDVFLEAAAAYTDANVPALPREVLQIVADYLGMAQVAPERAYVTEADVADYDRLFPLLAKAGYLEGGAPPAGSLYYLSSSRPKS